MDDVVNVNWHLDRLDGICQANECEFEATTTLIFGCENEHVFEVSACGRHAKSSLSYTVNRCDPEHCGASQMVTSLPL